MTVPSSPFSIPSQEPTSILLRTHNLCKYFSVGSPFLWKPQLFLKALNGVSLSVKRGEILGIVGESGCGKSTLAKTLVRLYTPTQGDIFFDSYNLMKVKGKKLRELQKKIQMVFQDPHSSLNPKKTIFQSLSEPFLEHAPWMNRSQRIEKVCHLLQQVELTAEYLNAYPHEMSGGQKQRLNIARAIALKPELLIADEAVSALDISIQAQILNLLKNLQKELQLTILFISHNLSVVKYLCHRVAVMYLGKVVELADTETLFQNPKHPYTQALLASIPTIPNTFPMSPVSHIPKTFNTPPVSPVSPVSQGRSHPTQGQHEQKNPQLMKGEVPSALHSPEGCSFHPRCPYKWEKCQEHPPPLLQVLPNSCAKTSPKKYRDATKEHTVACWLSEQE